MRVLLLDDEPLARLLARRGLEKAGCLVTEAESITQARYFWTSQSFDLVVLDNRLPDGRGCDLLVTMREQGRMERAVLLSADAEDLAADAAAPLANCDVLPKPLNVDRLLSLVQPAAGKRRSTSDTWSADRFLVVIPPVEISARDVDRLAVLCGGSKWVAVNMQDVERADSSAWTRLVEWAGECRGAGGLLCLLGRKRVEELAGNIRALDREIDVIEDLKEIEVNGSRLISRRERQSVLQLSRFLLS